MRDEHAGPAYRFPERVAPRGETVRVTPANAATLLGFFPDVERELDERVPCLAAVHDGRAVSVCYSARRSLRAAEAGVNTLPAYRHRGYAAAVTAAWASTVRVQGLLPLYSTTWDNAASRGVARALGLTFYASDLHLT